MTNTCHAHSIFHTNISSFQKQKSQLSLLIPCLKGPFEAGFCWFNLDISLLILKAPASAGVVTL